VYERSLNEAELVLSIQKEPLVPVHKIWEEVIKQSKVKGFEVASLPDFSAMLEGDRRFQIIPAQMKSQEDEEGSTDGELVDMEMENLGFFSEDRVRLRASRTIETVLNEDEEEVGSIRRKAFLSQNVIAKNKAIKKKTKAISKKSSNKSTKGKNIKISKKRPKQVRNRKSKTTTRGKK
jgi:hypothetical protein